MEEETYIGQDIDGTPRLIKMKWNENDIIQYGEYPLKDIKGLDMNKTYHVVVNCLGWPNKKSKEVIDNYAEVFTKGGLKVIITNEDVTFASITEVYVEPYFVGWVYQKPFKNYKDDYLVLVQLPDSTYRDCVAIDGLEVGDYVLVRQKDHIILQVVKPPKDAPE